MKINAKFKLNRKGFRHVVLKGNGIDFVKQVRPAVEVVAPSGTRVEESFGPTRIRIRIVDDAPNAAHREAQSGALSQALNRIHV